MEAIRANNIAICAIIIGAAISIGVQYYNGVQNRELERTQFESTLIINAIEKDDLNSTKENLIFLLESGIVSKENEKIQKILNDTILQIVFPTQPIKIIQPSNNSILHSSEDLFNGLIQDRKGNPVDSVLIETYYSSGMKRTKPYAHTYSDKNGLFSLPFPKDSKSITYYVKKDGYQSQKKIIPLGTTNKSRTITLVKTEESLFQDFF